MLLDGDVERRDVLDGVFDFVPLVGVLLARHNRLDDLVEVLEGESVLSTLSETSALNFARLASGVMSSSKRPASSALPAIQVR